MRIIKLLSLAIAISLQAFTGSIAVAASDCVNTPWVNSGGRTCASIGLNSKQPVCNGQVNAIMCDDTKTQIRTCRSNVQCNVKQNNDPYSIGGATLGGNTGGYNNSNNNNNNYGTNNSNSGQSGNNYEVFRGKKFHCTDWDYRNKRPCKSGTFNEDCWGNCS